MADSMIAQGVIKVEGDASGLDATMAKAGETLDTLGQKGAAAGKQVAQGLKEAGTGANASADQVDAAGKRILRSLEREAAQVGKTRSEYLQWLATQHNITSQSAPFIAKIREAEEAMRANGKTTRELQAALRGTPAQLTDIIVSLQGGQRPLTVLLQQGGQLKDMFGGTVPAVKALGGAVLGMVNPFTLAAGAVALLAYAYNQGADESQKFKNALVSSGNIVGQTSDSLQQMAERVADASKTTQSEAADIITQLVQTGQISGQALETAATGSAAAMKVLGIDAKDAVAQFEALGKDPVNAIQALNDKYHFLTAATYEQIKALAEQGDKQGAAKAAIETYTEALNGRTPQILQNLGYIERAWNAIVKGSKNAINELFSIGRDTTLQDRIDALQKQIANNQRLSQRGASVGVGASETAQLQAQLNALVQEQENGDIAAVAKATQQRQQDALVSWRNSNDKYLTQVAKVEKEHSDNVKQIEQMAKAAGVSNESLQSRLDQEQARYKKALESATSGDASKATRIDKANLSLDVERIQSERDKLLSIYSTSEQVMESMRQAGLLGDKEYYEAKYGYLVLESNAREQALQQEIARYQQENLSGADALEIQKKIADAQGKLDQERITRGAKIATLENQEASAIRAKASALLSARQAAQDYLDTTNRGYVRDLQTAWMGTSERTRASGVSQIEDRYQQQRQELSNQRALAELQAGGSLTEDVRKQYDERLAIINEFQQKALQNYDAYYAALKAGESDWHNGANKAIKDYLDESRNVAKQTEQAFSNALSGIEDAFVDLAMTGKLSFSDLAQSIIKDLIRIQARAAVSGLSGLFGEWLKGSSVPSNADTVIPMQAGGGYHSGGIVGLEQTFTRSVPSSVFSGARKYHSGGLAGDEVPAILKRGEGVFTPGQMRAMGASSPNISVTINNTMSDQAEVSAKPRMNNGQVELEVIVQRVMASDARRNGPITQGMAQTFGIQRSAF